LVKGVEKMYSYGGVDRKYIEEIQKLRGVKKKTGKVFIDTLWFRILGAIVASISWAYIGSFSDMAIASAIILVLPASFLIIWAVQANRAFKREVPEEVRKAMMEKRKEEPVSFYRPFPGEDPLPGNVDRFITGSYLPGIDD